MAHKAEFISTKGGFKVKNGSTVTEVINQDGTLNVSAIIDDASITLAKLAAGIAPSHVIKFAKLGSTITTTALAGLAVGDLVIRILAADGTVTCKPVATIDTLPDDPEDGDYVIVLRAAA